MSELIEKDGKYYKELEVVMLSTYKYPALLSSIGRVKAFCQKKETLFGWEDCAIRTPHSLNHLYLISDEKPKKGDWIIRENHPRPILMGDDLISKGDKKIVATTDFNLKIFVESEDGNYTTYGKGYFIELPKINKEFIELFSESYNDGNDIKTVLVECKLLKEDLIEGKKYFLDKSQWKVKINQTEGIYLKEGKIDNNGNIDIRAYVCIDEKEDTRIYCDKEDLYTGICLKLNNNNIIIKDTEEKAYTEEEIIFGVRKMLKSENIRFDYVREELPRFLEEAKKEIISFKTNLKK